MSSKLLLTPEAARELLGCVGRDRLYEWCRNGTLTSVRYGRRYYIARSAVDKLVRDIAAGKLSVIN